MIEVLAQDHPQLQKLDDFKLVTFFQVTYYRMREMEKGTIGMPLECLKERHNINPTNK